jgi:hypothetical protein
MKNSPTTPMMASGTNLSTVVTSWTAPPSRAPRMLVAVSSQMRAMPTRAPSSFSVPAAGQNTAR